MKDNVAKYAPSEKITKSVGSIQAIHVKEKRGFTLVESVVLMFIFSVISLVFLQVYVVGTRLIIDSKNRLGAVALANQKMEVIRSIEYEDIGTKSWNGSSWVYGVPGGDLLQEEEVAVNNRQFHVSTFVQYVDDAFDGVSGGNPNDSTPTDYKRVRIQVAWGDADSEHVILFGSFTPNGLETAVAGGTLSVNVLHADGSGVGGASVSIQNSAKNISVNAVTDAGGNVTLPGMPAASQGYTITVSKSGFYGATTYPPYPTTSYNPVDIHATVVANTLNQFSIIMDEAVQLPLKTVNPYDEAIGNVNFGLSGGRVLGTNPSTGNSVYSLTDTSRNTNASGEYTYSDQSYGVYTFTLGSSSSSQYVFHKILPETSAVVNKIDAEPGSIQQYKIVLLDKAFASLRVTVIDSSTGSPLAGASVRLQKSDSSYDATATTDQYGLTFLPETTTPLTAGQYTLTVNATGYNEKSETITVDASLLEKEVSLTTN